MTMEPQVEGVHDADVIGVAGVDIAGAEDIDIPPPPQALKTAVSKVQAAAANHPRPLTRV
jgi:hypothetical protein